MRNAALNYRKISLIVATIAVFTPAMSQATPERDGFKACASAFASSLASRGGAVLSLSPMPLKVEQPALAARL